MSFLIFRKSVSHFPSFFFRGFCFFRFCSSSYSSSSSQSPPQEVNIIDKNKQELREIAKEVFPKIENYSTKKKLEVFLTYSAYQLLDDVTYSVIEKDFIKHLNGFTSTQLISIIEGVARCQKGSPKFQMLLEQYFLKNIHNLTVKESLRLSRALVRAFQQRNQQQPSTSKRLCESLHLFFMNKLNEFDSLQKLQMMVSLLQILKSRRSVYSESLDLIFERTIPKIHQLTKHELLLFGHLFFSAFLEGRALQLEKRERALESVNSIMQGRIELSQVETKEVQTKIKLFDSERSFIEHKNSYSESVLKNIEEFTVKDYQVVCEMFAYHSTPLGKQIQSHLETFVSKNYLEFSPKEIFSISSFIDLNYILLYLQNYKKELEYIDLLNFFKTVKMQTTQCYGECLSVVEDKIYQIREKWDLDESIYLLCAREDQQALFNNSKHFQAEREKFIKELMANINKELRIRPANGFKVFYTIWKLLFRSQVKLDSSYMNDLLDNMQKTMRIGLFDSFMRTVEILGNVSEQYPEYADKCQLVLLALEEKYTLKISGNEDKISDSNVQERKKIQYDQNQFINNNFDNQKSNTSRDQNGNGSVNKQQ